MTRPSRRRLIMLLSATITVAAITVLLAFSHLNILIVVGGALLVAVGACLSLLEAELHEQDKRDYRRWLRGVR